MYLSTSGAIPVENIPRAMIAHIPKDIVVLEAVEIPLDWEATLEYIR